ncbi:MAG: ribonuclease P protein component 1 [Candidatus Micrarchaeia archaeon]
MITPENILVHELIGLKVRVVESLSRPHEGIEGVVVGETLNTLLVQSLKGKKRVPKKNTKFEFELPDGRRVVVNGEDILNRPENRLKRGIHKI